MRKFLIFNIAVLFIGITLIAVFIKNTTDIGIEKITTVDEFIDFASNFPVISMDTSATNKDDTANSCLNDKERWLEQLTNESMLSHSDVNILIIKADNQLKQYYGTFCQSGLVSQVIHGDETLIGKTISIVNYGGIRIDYNTPIFVGEFGKNIMLPDNEYLIFCEKTEISDYLNKPLYRTIPTFFSRLNLSSDYSNIVNISESTTYDNYKDSEFLVNYQESLDALVKLKKEIISTYIEK